MPKSMKSALLNRLEIFCAALTKAESQRFVLDIMRDKLTAEGVTRVINGTYPIPG